MRGIEVVPSAKRLITSLRDLGYDLPQAVADIVDNSIEAGATVIKIDLEFLGDDSWLRISDNGRGMSKTKLLEAMRYGSDGEYDGETSLGKFGLGMKTASLSQCQRLTVASRSSATRASISGYLWDLKHIQRTNRWEVLELPPDELSLSLYQQLRDSTGTVVVWNRLDRILDYKHPSGATQQRQFSAIFRELEAHLSMVFHKFLSGQLARKKLKIYICGNPIEAWDPFCTTQSETIKCDTFAHPVVEDGKAGAINFEPFILPREDQFDSPEAHKLGAGPKKWNDQQGFYFYRADRMIQSGGWSGLRTRDEHIKLARIAVRFSPSLDDALKINVAKMRVQLPPAIIEKIRDQIKVVVGQATTRYRQSAQTAVSNPPGTAAHPSPPDTKKSISVPMLTEDQWASRLLVAATSQERPFVQKAINRLKSQTRK